MNASLTLSITSKSSGRPSDCSPPIRDVIPVLTEEMPEIPVLTMFPKKLVAEAAPEDRNFGLEKDVCKNECDTRAESAYMISASDDWLEAPTRATRAVTGRRDDLVAVWALEVVAAWLEEDEEEEEVVVVVVVVIAAAVVVVVGP